MKYYLRFDYKEFKRGRKVVETKIKGKFVIYTNHNSYVHIPNDLVCEVRICKPGDTLIDENGIKHLVFEDFSVFSTINLSTYKTSIFEMDLDENSNPIIPKGYKLFKIK